MVDICLQQSVEVNQSLIPNAGDGLFAAKQLPRGHRIYAWGTFLSVATFKNEQKSKDFIPYHFVELWSTKPKIFLKFSLKCPAYYANGADYNHMHNAVFLADETATELSHQYLFIELVDEVTAGTEIIVQYRAG